MNRPRVGTVVAAVGIAAFLLGVFLLLRPTDRRESASGSWAVVWFDRLTSELLPWSSTTPTRIRAGSNISGFGRVAMTYSGQPPRVPRTIWVNATTRPAEPPATRPQTQPAQPPATAPTPEAPL
ncbi:MAG TPA: hypothetical protein VF796_04975 [Humisphaera sp.]